MAVILTVVEALQTVSKILKRKTAGTGDQRKNNDCLNNDSVKLSKDSEKGPGNLRRPAVTQTFFKITS